VKSPGQKLVSATEVPSLLDIERNLLAVLMQRPEIWEPTTREECFSTTLTRTVFREIVQLRERRERADLATVIISLLAAKLIQGDDAPVISGWGEHLSGVPLSPAALKKMVDCLLQSHARRELLRLGNNRAADLTTPLDEILRQQKETAEGLQKLVGGDDAEQRILRLADIPDLMLMERFGEPEWLIDGIIGEHWIVCWMGAPKSGKSIAMTRLSEELSRGGSFLERKCRQTSVLYIDYEMDPRYVRQRRELMGYGPNPNLYWWHNGLPECPPGILDDRLIKLVEREKPLVIFDPFRYAHDQEENESDAMTPVMKRLREFARLGAGCIFVHHSTKADKKVGRGSGTIEAGFDLQVVQEVKGGLVVMTCDKPRYSAPWSVTARLDEDTLNLEIAESAHLRAERGKIEKIEEAIADNPGITRNLLAEKTGMRPGTITSLQKKTGRWSVKPGPRSSNCFYLKTTETLEQLSPTGSGTQLGLGQLEQHPTGCSSVPLGSRSLAPETTDGQLVVEEI
jgi:hypothetical protein